MKLDPKTLTLVAPAASVLGSLIGFASAVRPGPERNGTAVLSSFLALVGSVAWLATAYQDQLEQGELELV